MENHRWELRSACVFALLVAILSASGCKTAPILNIHSEPHRFSESSDIDDIRYQIERMAEANRWSVRTVQPGRLFARMESRRHSAYAIIDFDSEVFSIDYLGSTNLKADDRVIHRAYNVWVEGLAKDIRR